ncbi:DUF4064 domain-containing protein [Jeotgalibaca ciconiae]|uniref:DUF4064 domain-containing protein n=1 Tax=Jeotgalibaca ciconiae TaxID=2496265 RepID=A0A3Q9BL54_9LACT|nr:DUF4064 domain-containing protein [Jeotgalibaca ciconiae]AZP04471.1 DUF4064 domain-containing protein [Jeotgalibaca ciconiae]HJB24027.1 DUF4064 domain-containing protein [Candidatus Jeotgalibaca pullicola]
MSRKPEKVIAIIGACLVLLFLGGFALTVLNMDIEKYREVIVPIFEGNFSDLASEEGFQNMRTLGAWFSATAFITLVFVALGNLFISNNRYPYRAAICFGLTGIAVLFGSQLIAYPLAFIFFVVTAMSLFRKK